MPTREELLAEAKRRGIKVPETKNPDLRSSIAKQALIAEARKRGLIDDNFDADKVDPKPSKWAAMLRGGLEGATLGWSDEIAARIGSLRTDRTYEEGLKKLSGETNAAYRAHPGTAFLSELAGGLATGGAGTSGVLASSVVRGAPLVARVGMGALAGANTGAISGAGHAEPGHREEGGLIGAGIGGVLGGVTAPLASGIRKGVDRLRPTDRVAQDAIEAHFPHGQQSFSKVIEEMAAKPEKGANSGEFFSGLFDLFATGGISLGTVKKALSSMAGTPSVPKHVINRITSVATEKNIDDFMNLDEATRNLIRSGVIPDNIPDGVKELAKVIYKPNSTTNTIARNAAGLAHGTGTSSAVGQLIGSRRENP